MTEFKAYLYTLLEAISEASGNDFETGMSLFYLAQGYHLLHGDKGKTKFKELADKIYDVVVDAHEDEFETKKGAN